MKRAAEVTTTIVFALNILFHLLVLAGVIPSDIVWGSRIESQRQFLLLESVSLLMNSLFLLIMLMRIEVVKNPLGAKVVNGTIWFMMGFFLLNTLGNLASGSLFEKVVFTPLTLTLVICLFVSLKIKDHDKEHLAISEKSSPIHP